MNDTIVVTGCNGQLGQFLIKYLQDTQPTLKIVGTVRHKSYDDQPYIFDKSKVSFELMDLQDQASIESLILKYKPTYFVNTAANAFVGDSWKVPVQHIENNTIGVLHQLEAIRKHSPHTRYFNMGTSEEFGNTNLDTNLQYEETPLDPKSPYGVSKAAARHLINVYRKSYGMYAVQNFTFNFESELRGKLYVTKKVTLAVARISKALKANLPFEPLQLGNLDSNRAWQFAGDVAVSIWLSLNQERYNRNYTGKPVDYVVSCGISHSIRELVTTAFQVAGITGTWVNEKFMLGNVILVETNPQNLRPSDVTFLNGDSTKIKTELGWKPTLDFNALIERMVNYDLTANN